MLNHSLLMLAGLVAAASAATVKRTTGCALEQASIGQSTPFKIAAYINESSDPVQLGMLINGAGSTATFFSAPAADNDAIFNYPGGGLTWNYTDQNGLHQYFSQAVSQSQQITFDEGATSPGGENFLVPVTSYQAGCDNGIYFDTIDFPPANWPEDTKLFYYCQVPEDKTGSKSIYFGSGPAGSNDGCTQVFLRPLF